MSGIWEEVCMFLLTVKHSQIDKKLHMEWLRIASIYATITVM